MALLAVAALGALAAVGVGVRAVLARQAAIARRRIGKPHGEDVPGADRVWRRRLAGEPLRLLVLGDSVAAGLGAPRRKDTPGARVAKGLARATGRPVALHTAARVGAESSALAGQLDALPAGYRADVALVVVGGNDVTHRIPLSTSILHLRAAVTRLRALGAGVVVGTCPDLGAVRAVPQPLRELLSRSSRRLAGAQAAAAGQAGAHVVSLRDAVGGYFVARSDEAFGVDGFHPSALGYRRTAEALLPAVVTAATASASAAQTGERGRSAGSARRIG